MRYKIRFALAGECAQLPELERVAAKVFLPYLEVTGLSAEKLEHTNSEADYGAAQAAELLWVVADQDDSVVGFAMLRALGAGLHLQEIDVHPNHSRRGLGTNLLQRVCADIQAGGASALSLTTYRHVPWNAPFYSRLGFRILEDEEMSEPLRALRVHEAQMGWPLWARVVMQKDF